MSLVKSLPCGRSRKASSLKLTTKTLVLVVGVLHQRQRRGFHLGALVAHAAAVVDDQAHGNRHVFALETLDLLLHAVLENREGLLRQVGDQVAVLVHHRGVADHQARVRRGRRRRSSSGGASGRLDLLAVQRPTAAQSGRATAIAQKSFIGRSIIAQSPERPQRRQAARLNQLHLHVPVLPVVLLVLRRIAQDVLVAQFDSDFGGDIRQFVQVLHRVLAPAGLLGDFGQQRRPGSSPPASARAQPIGFVNSDRIDLDVRFLHQVLDFCLGVAAVVVAAVGDHQQRLARVLGLLHFVQAQVDGVQQRGPPLGLGEGQAVLDLLQVVGERLHQVGAVVELHQEELVLGIGGLEELRHRLPRFFQLVPHAAAAIENHAHRKRRVFAGKLR